MHEATNWRSLLSLAKVWFKWHSDFLRVIQSPSRKSHQGNMKYRNGILLLKLFWPKIRQSKINSRIWSSTSVIFFRLFIDLGQSKLFTFSFVFFWKNKQIDWKYFCKEFCKKSWKKIILGSSDAWSTIHLAHRPSEPAYYIIKWRI